MLKLKFQSFGHLMWRADSLEKTLMLGKIEGRRRKGWQRMRWLDGITDSMDMGLGPGVGNGQRGLVCYGSWGCKESDTTKWLNWTECMFQFYSLKSPHPSPSLCPKVYPLCLHLLCCPANRIISEVPVSVGKAQQDRVNVIRLASLGASLVVQWLNPMLLTQGAWVRSLVRKLDPSCHI